MSPPRFLVPQLPNSGPLDLDEAESRHACGVLRLQVGDAVEVFDGQGGEAQARIVQIQKRSVELNIDARTDANRELHWPLTLDIALPKGDRQKTLVEGLVQLGVTNLVPLHCQRGVAQPTGKAILRLERMVIEASKQCRRNHLMRIAPPIPLANLSQSTTEPTLRMFAHPYGTAATARQILDANASLPNPKNVEIAVGPEGGFTAAEVAELQDSGWLQFSLGPRILRIEMAAIAIASIHASLQPQSGLSS
ncbi:RsmE family RNA methyltransferase [Aureliella helgolandensis]|uniref:Ribosomal RNA small subunit methyltransferase E n=1 Tax=Aureliella helgolandensis TaxID=2527968 RepID=A0A518G0Z1_9BACT|nr:RsmE family RNA methyltransferase [Aureliella helgolandensis]QDV22184.1 Ribosomal RNA small subunit methyltransferase E [Aureliella helgolandensis]